MATKFQEQEDTTKKSGLFGLQADYGPQTSLSLDEFFDIKRPSIFLFEMSHNDFKPHICAGDILVVNRALSPKSGDLILGHYEDQFICRRLRIENQRELLYGVRGPPLEFQDEGFTLFGVVIGLTRKFR